MRVAFLLLGLCSVSVWGAQIGRERRQSYPRPQQAQRYPPQGFRINDDDQDDELDHNTVAPALIQRPQAVQYRPQERRQEYTQKRPGPSRPNLKEEELEEEEKEEPDRLTELLPQSKFTCQGRGTGYYADEGLQCEVFHYCQDNQRHSWICPEGFLFHQVHLICMPPSTDNICQQSSQFHFVNDYLYKPINADEAQRKPNVTLRYSERYYPEAFYSEENVIQTASPRPPSSQPKIIPQQEVKHRPQPVLQYRQSNQVFHSPEEVNIPLQHRRPIASPQPSRGYSQPSEEYEY